MAKYIDLQPTPDGYAKMGARMAANVIMVAQNGRATAVKQQMEAIIEICLHLGAQPDAPRHKAFMLEQIRKSFGA